MHGPVPKRMIFTIDHRESAFRSASNRRPGTYSTPFCPQREREHRSQARAASVETDAIAVFWRCQKTLRETELVETRFAGILMISDAWRKRIGFGHAGRIITRELW